MACGRNAGPEVRAAGLAAAGAPLGAAEAARGGCASGRWHPPGRAVAAQGGGGAVAAAAPGVGPRFPLG